MKRLLSVLAGLALSIYCAATIMAHCQIPCGIYGDKMRFDMIAENITTLEKAMNQINELSKQGDKNYNQIVRWIVNKEEHANYIKEIVTDYFLMQRIDLADTSSEEYDLYLKKVTVLHEMLIYAMKAKQTTDLQYIDKLRQTLESFRQLYFDPEHMKKHGMEGHDH